MRSRAMERKNRFFVSSSMQSIFNIITFLKTQKDKLIRHFLYKIDDCVGSRRRWFHRSVTHRRQ